MEFIIEFVLTLVGEIVLGIVGEALVELGFHALTAPFRYESHPLLALLGYPAVGAFVGGVSTWVAPDPVITDPAFAVAYLVVMPIVAGAAMAGIGALRARRGQSLIRLDAFGYAWLFALSFGLMRWLLIG